MELLPRRDPNAPLPYDDELREWEPTCGLMRTSRDLERRDRRIVNAWMVQPTDAESEKKLQPTRSRESLLHSGSIDPRRVDSDVPQCLHVNQPAHQGPRRFGRNASR